MRRAGAYLRLSTLTTSSQSPLTSVSARQPWAARENFARSLAPPFPMKATGFHWGPKSKVRSAPFPAKATGFCRKLRSLPCFSFAGKAGGVPWRYISVALVRGFPLAGVTRYPCPVEPGLSSRTGFRRVRAAVWPAAVYFTSNLPGKSIKLLYLRPSRDIIRR